MRRLKRDGYDGWVSLKPHIVGEALLDFYAQEISSLRRLLEQA